MLFGGPLYERCDMNLMCEKVMNRACVLTLISSFLCLFFNQSIMDVDMNVYVVRDLMNDDRWTV